jgi:HEAT repeat protein
MTSDSATIESRSGFRVCVLAIVALAATSGCLPEPSRLECLERSNEILYASLRHDRSEVRALAMEALSDLQRPVPDAEFDVIVRKDLPPARFAAMMARAEQARRNHLKYSLLRMMQGRPGDFTTAAMTIPRAIGSRSSALRSATFEIIRELRRGLPSDESLNAVLMKPDTAAKLSALLTETKSQRDTDHAFFISVLRGDDDPSVRLSAVYGLARVGDERHMVALARGLEDKRPSSRRTAATILGRLGNRSASALLAEHRGDGDVIVRIRVAEAMALLGDTSALPELRAMVSGEVDLEVWHRQMAILSLGRVGIPEQDVSRLQWIETRGGLDSALRLAAFGARGMLGDYSQMTVLSEVGTGTRRPFGMPTWDNQSRAFALQMLARTSYGLAWRDVRQGLSDRDPEVRLSAAWAMQSFSNPRAERVIKAIESPQRPDALTERQVLRKSGKALPTGQPGGVLAPDPDPRRNGPKGTVFP